LPDVHSWDALSVTASNRFENDDDLLQELAKKNQGWGAAALLLCAPA
jgi:hypothetical protein